MAEDVSAWRPHPWHGLPVGPKPPALYGFLPRTSAGRRVAALMPAARDRS